MHPPICCPSTKVRQTLRYGQAQHLAEMAVQIFDPVPSRVLIRDLPGQEGVNERDDRHLLASCLQLLCNLVRQNAANADSAQVIWTSWLYRENLFDVRRGHRFDALEGFFPPVKPLRLKSV